MSLEEYSKSLQGSNNAVKRFFDMEQSTLSRIGSEDGWIQTDEVICKKDYIGDKRYAETMDCNRKEKDGIVRCCSVTISDKMGKGYGDIIETPENGCLYTLELPGKSCVNIFSTSKSITYSLSSQEYIGPLLTISEDSLMRGHQKRNSGELPRTDLNSMAISENDKSILDILRREIDKNPQIAKYSDIIINAFSKIVSLDPERSEIVFSNEQLASIQKARCIETLEKRIEEQKKTIGEQEKVIEEQKKTIEEQAKAMEEQKKTIEEQAKAMEEQKKTIEEQAEVISKNQSMLQQVFSFFDRHLNKGWIKMMLGKEGKAELQAIGGLTDGEDR